MNREPTDIITQLSEMGAEIGRNSAIHESVEIVAKRIVIGDNVQIGPNTRICAREFVFGEDVRIGTNCILQSKEIRIGNNSRIGNNNDIQPHAFFTLGNTSHIGNQAHIRGREVTLGDEVFVTNGFRVGGGGRNEPEATLRIGDRCTMHNNFINIAKPVTVGNDVGFSPETILITHGYWQSVLDGYSATYAPITIHDWVILGMRTIILPGVEIGEGTTVGAGSIVTHSLPARCVAVGVPARVIKTDYPSRPSQQEQDTIMIELLHSYKDHLVDRGYEIEYILKEEHGILLETSKDGIKKNISYFRGPHIPPQAFEGVENILLTFDAEKTEPKAVIMNLRTLKIDGTLTPLVHDLRDFLRRHGIRFFGYGFFRSLPPQIALDFDDI